MAAIKEIPTNFRVYYTSMRDAYTQKKNEAENLLRDLNKQIAELYVDIKAEFNLKGAEYGIDLNKYPEFVNNKYQTGEFLRVAKGFFINKGGNYELIGSRFNLYNLAKLQKDVDKIERDLIFINRMLKLSLAEYKDILKMYYFKVHEKLICDGQGYVFGNDIGWVCLNRCKVVTTRPKLDYAKTKERKKQLLAEGRRLYNKEEALWCKERGIEYDGVDYRVMCKLDYCYELPLLGCKLPNAHKLKLEQTNWINRELRDKTKEELIQLCDGDIRKICALDMSIKSKLNLCLQVDKMLYSKLIRNENQTAHNFRKIDRKGGQ